MKKLVGLTAIVLLLTISINAQGNKNKQRKGSDFTPEQTTTLKVKQMALRLDLNESQQKDVYDLMVVNAKERKNAMDERKENKTNGVQMTSEQKFEMQNTRLDKMIAHKASMKTILSKDQFEKWEKMMASKKKAGKKGMAQNNKKGSKGANQKSRPNKNRI